MGDCTFLFHMSAMDDLYKYKPILPSLPLNEFPNICFRTFLLFRLVHEPSPVYSSKKNPNSHYNTSRAITRVWLGSRLLATQPLTAGSIGHWPGTYSVLQAHNGHNQRIPYFRQPPYNHRTLGGRSREVQLDNTIYNNRRIPMKDVSDCPKVYHKLRRENEIVNKRCWIVENSSCSWLINCRQKRILEYSFKTVFAGCLCWRQSKTDWFASGTESVKML